MKKILNNTIPQERRRLINKRTNIFVFFIFFCFIILSYSLFNLQIIHGREYKEAGDRQYFLDIGESFDRGSIFFSNKTNIISPAVEMYNEYDIAIDPKTINSEFKKKIDKDEKNNIEEIKDNLYTSIESIFLKWEDKNIDINSSSSVQTFLSKEEFISKINNQDSSFEILKKNVPEDIANDLIGLHIRGLIISRKKSRVYFEKEIAAKILGFVGFNDTKKTGLYGIERYYNDILEKDPISNSNIFAEIFSDFKKENSNNNEIKKSFGPGSNLKGDIYLTIDINVERYLDQILAKIKNKWNPQKVGGIIMDINDGSIIAMDEMPSFDPNNYKNVTNISLYNNDLVSGVYEMGSIIKPLTVAAALDSGLVNEYTTYNDTGSITINGYKVSNYDKRARGPNTQLQEILSQSLNVGIAFLVEKMGGNLFSEYFHNFGIGEYTGIDLPNEASGLVANLDTKVDVDSVTAGFGQGIAITPIQTIRALATLGNGGKLITPHIVKKIVYDNGYEKNIATDDTLKVFNNASTSERISKILTKVVDDAMHIKNPKYTVAAKTGTAQMVNPDTHKYYEDRYLHSFFGYFPATKPKYIIFLYQVYPKDVEYASQSLKDYFFDLVNYLIKYYEIQPDR